MASPAANFEEAALAMGLEGRRTLLMRLVGAGLGAIFFALSVDPVLAGTWAGLVVVAEGGVHGLTAVVSRAASRAWARRTLLAFALLLATLWPGLAWAYWQTGEAFLQVTAVTILAVQLFHASIFAYRSAWAFALSGGGAITCALVLPWAGAYTPFQAATMATGLMLAVAYAVNAAASNFRVMAQLRATEAELLRQSEAANAANHAKTAFLATMSHELRTPMNGVIGTAHALATTSLDAEQARLVSMQVHSGAALLALLNDILDLSKIESGRLDLETVSFDLHALAASACEHWAPAAEQRGLEVSLSLAEGTPQWVTGDPTRLRQILMNLLSNGMKFTHEGGIHVSLSCSPEASGALGVTLAVADTGVGMSAEAQARLFEDYSQGAASTYRQYGGTGLGLAICRRLAQGMGGEIRVDSEPGAGTTFTVTIRLGAGDAIASEPDADAAVDLTGLRILVADDNPINLAVAQVILEAAGLVVVVAADGREALEILRAGPIDCVILDIHMPNMDGREAVHEIRAGRAGPADVPVVALTGDVMSGEDVALLEHGFDSVQPKPIQPAMLLSALAALLAAKDGARPDAGLVTASGGTACGADRPQRRARR